MKTSANVWYSDGTTSVITTNKAQFTLEELQEAIGGHITFIRNKDRVLIVDEEGECKQLDLNDRATQYAEMPIFGTVVVPNCLEGL